MNQFDVRALLKVREGKLEGFKQQAAEMMRKNQAATVTLAIESSNWVRV